jgi:hypothetical protein
LAEDRQVKCQDPVRFKAWSCKLAQEARLSLVDRKPERAWPACDARCVNGFTPRRQERDEARTWNEKSRLSSRLFSLALPA